MKFKFTYNKRHSMYITLFACGASVWMMVARFGLSVNDLLVYLAITVGFLVAFIGIAALLGYVLGRMRDD